MTNKLLNRIYKKKKTEYNIFQLENNLPTLITQVNDKVYKSVISKMELQHYCKEWLINELHYSVLSGNGNEKLNGYQCIISSFYGGEEEIFYGETEYKAIVEACLSVLED